MAAMTKTVRPHTTCRTPPPRTPLLGTLPVARRLHSLQAPLLHTYSLPAQEKWPILPHFRPSCITFLAKKAPVSMQIGSLSVQNQLKPSDFPLQTLVSANPHLINLIHDACFCGSIGHFFCFAQSSWRDCGTVVGSVPWIPFFVSGRPGNTGMRHALPTTPSYGPTLSHDASR